MFLSFKVYGTEHFFQGESGLSRLAAINEQLNNNLKTPYFKILITFLILLSVILFAFQTPPKFTDDKILSCTVNPKLQHLEFYWKDDKGNILKSIHNLKAYSEQKNGKLVFAMNAGMFNQGLSPKGLFIQQQKVVTPLDTATGNGNFYLQPNGVFYITTDNTPVVCATKEFSNNGKIKYATQSGPMLVIDGNIHTAFNAGSKNLNIRNGVGVLPDGQVVFAMSKTEINFFDFANFFNQRGCKNALYLDGFVSRTYLPEQNWIQTDGNFAVMIGVSQQVKK